QMEFVNKFTPVGYPATIESVCSSFITVAGGTPDLFYDIVVYDDDGAGGAPGTLIGEMTGLTAVNIPIFSAGDPAIWQSENTSSENWVINEGDVYIGVRFSPTTPNHYIATDESTSTPLVEGYWWNDSAGDWAPITDAFPATRSLFVRAEISGDGNPPGGECDQSFDGAFSLANSISGDLGYTVANDFVVAANNSMEIETLRLLLLPIAGSDADFDSFDVTLYSDNALTPGTPVTEATWLGLTGTSELHTETFAGYNTYWVTLEIPDYTIPANSTDTHYWI